MSVTRAPDRNIDASIAERAHRLTLENPGDPVPDGDGGFIEGWTVIAALWGRLAPASAADLERIVAGTVTAILPYLAVVPYVDGVTTLTRLVYHGRYFAVMAVRNVDERNVRLEIICEERVSNPGLPLATAAAGGADG